MRVYCKKDVYLFKHNHYYNISGVFSVFDKDDFISIEVNHNIFRFRMNESIEYIEDYIGEFELYFYNYFNSLSNDRKRKLCILSDLTKKC